MSAWIDTTYVDNSIGSLERAAMSDSSADVMTQLIAQASALVDSVLALRGYTISTASDIVKVMTLGAFLPLLYGRKGQRVPEQLSVHTNVLEAVRTGALIPTGVDPIALRAVGGVSFASSDETTTTGRPAMFTSMRTAF